MLPLLETLPDDTDVLLFPSTSASGGTQAPCQQTPPPTSLREASLALKPQGWAVLESHEERVWFCFSSDHSNALHFSGVWAFVLSGLEPCSTS